MNQDTEKIIKAAKAGGEVLKKYFGMTLETVQKSSASDFRTQADLDSEQAILSMLKENFPSYNIHSEEFGEINNGSEFTFVIDPLDGTSNFVLGVPNFTVSIGLMKGREIISGVVFAPIINALYYAEKGRGAYFDGKKLSVGSESDIKNASISYYASYGTPAQEQSKILGALHLVGAKRILTPWSSAYDLCLLACGKLEGLYVDHLEIYDFAAGKLIAKEAGAKFTGLNGVIETEDLSPVFVASNGTKIHEHILALK